MAIHHELNPQASLNSTTINLFDDLGNLVLQDHLLQLNHVLFKGNRIYRHRLFCINYTTYDLQRESDCIREQHTLDTVRFLPMADKGAFGFVDPADVLRGCHVIPSFTDGPLHPDNVAMSRCAGDSDDWKQYYINR